MLNMYPSKNILKKYAEILINFALNSGKGIQKDEVVQISIPDCANPLALELQNSTLKAGGHPILRLIPTGFDKDYYALASDKQLTFFPENFLKAKAQMLDHQVVIIADPYPEELSKIPPSKIMLSRNSQKPYRDWITKKENQDKYTWTIALWATEAKAKEVNLSLKNYWKQIIKGCFLDFPNPTAEWKKLFKEQNKIKTKLNSLKIEYVKIEGKNANLKIKIGGNRIWNGGSGRNIPSFEIFTSPDWRETEGWMYFNEPLYRYGNIIRDVYFEFKKGIVVKAKAKTGNKLLQEMLKTKNANKIGEFSLTDKDMSRITHVMAETLFDENIGGPFGNTHIAIGKAYQDCYNGNITQITKESWEKLGFNDSSEHTDFISTTDRTVTAILKDRCEKVIYSKGKFVV